MLCQDEVFIPSLFQQFEILQRVENRTKGKNKAQGLNDTFDLRVRTETVA